MEVLKDRYTITELSQRLNITDHALRYYEKEFNINVPKDHRGRRYYTPDLANLMFQIKNMRDEGLEIKAIKKILLAENIISEPPPVVIESNSTAITPFGERNQAAEIKEFFENITGQLTACVSSEVNSVKDHLSKEIYKTKLELGACVENNIRKLESKLEKHFEQVDKSIGQWRERTKQGPVKRFMYRIFK